MNKISLKELLINLAFWAGIAIALVALGSYLVGCSLAEWKDVGTDAGAIAVKAAPKVAVSPDPATLIMEVCGAVGAIIAGWYSRKFVEKRYSKKETSDAA